MEDDQRWHLAGGMGIGTRIITGDEAAEHRARRDALNAQLEESRHRFRETGTVPGPAPEEITGIRAASERLGRDMMRTTSRLLELVPFVDDGDTVVCIWLDGQHYGWFGLDLGVGSAANVENAVARVADQAREHSLDEAVWGGWPICPRQHTHPLEAVLSEGQAVWVCIADGTIVARIGDLDTIG